MLSTSILSYCNKLLDDDELLSLPPRKTISSSLSSLSLNSRLNTFRIKYLGSTRVITKHQNIKDGMSTLQKPILDIYSSAQRKHLQRSFVSYTQPLNQVVDVCNYGIVIGESDPTARTTLKVNGSTNVNRLNDVVVTKVITPLSNIILWAALRFNSRLITHKRRNQLGAAFLPIACCDAVFTKRSFIPLTVKQRFLVSLSHPPLFMCVLRKVSDPKVLECHLFACNSPEDAINLCTNLSNAQHYNSKIGALELPPSRQFGVYSYKSSRKSRSSPDTQFDASDTDAIHATKYSPSISYSRVSSNSRYRPRKWKAVEDLSVRPAPLTGRIAQISDAMTASDPSSSDLNEKCDQINCDACKRRQSSRLRYNKQDEHFYCCEHGKTARKREYNIHRKKRVFANENKKSPKIYSNNSHLETVDENFVHSNGVSANRNTRENCSNQLYKSRNDKKFKKWMMLSEDSHPICERCARPEIIEKKSDRSLAVSRNRRYFGDSLPQINEQFASDSNSNSNSNSNCCNEESCQQCYYANSEKPVQSRIESNNYNGYVVTVKYENENDLRNYGNKAKKTMVITKTVQLSTETESNSDSILQRNGKYNKINGNRSRNQKHANDSFQKSCENANRETNAQFAETSLRNNSVKMYLPAGVTSFNNNGNVHSWATLSLHSDFDDPLLPGDSLKNNIPHLMPLQMTSVNRWRPQFDTDQTTKRKHRSSFFKRIRRALSSKERSFISRFRKSKKRKKRNASDSTAETIVGDNLRNENVHYEQNRVTNKSGLFNNECSPNARLYETCISSDCEQRSGDKQHSRNRNRSMDAQHRSSSESTLVDKECYAFQCATDAKKNTRVKTVESFDEVDNRQLFDSKNWSHVNLQTELGYLP